jgi:AAA domain-containing protein/TIR domain-containing protein
MDDKIFISYRNQAPDSEIAEAFYEALTAAGIPTFMAARSIRLGDVWSRRIDEALRGCGYFLLLLSQLSADSEMVIEEVRQARALRDQGASDKPVILPVRINIPMDYPLNYDLRGYLQRIQQGEWTSPEDTAKLVQLIVELAGGSRKAIGSNGGKAQGAEGAAMPAPPADAPPSPVAAPELPGGGTVELVSRFYVERPPCEQDCYREIEKPGALIRIKAPRQMGKTSLMARILHEAEKKGHKVVPLSLQIADAKTLTDLDRFLKWLCAVVSRRIKIPAGRVGEHWDEIYGSKDNCTSYFEEVVLPEVGGPLVLALDEVDRLFEYPELAEEVLGLLRVWHEEAKTSEVWRQLRLIVVHSTEVYIPLNINQSPFNVGLPVRLEELTAEQMLDLAQRHQLPWGMAEVEVLRGMIGGHPYLSRVSMYYLSRGEMTLNNLLSTAASEEGLFADHLKRHLWTLERHPALGEAMKKAVTSPGPLRIRAEEGFKLQSMGLIHLEGNDISPRCDLYRKYFLDRLA